MINCILQPSEEQIQGATPYLYGTRFKVITKKDNHSHTCRVWGYLDNKSNGDRDILTRDLKKMNLICTQL